MKTEWCRPRTVAGLGVTTVETGPDAKTLADPVEMTEASQIAKTPANRVVKMRASQIAKTPANQVMKMRASQVAKTLGRMRPMVEPRSRGMRAALGPRMAATPARTVAAVRTPWTLAFRTRGHRMAGGTQVPSTCRRTAARSSPARCRGR
ncbi:hypothetical protein [Myxococcus qinghaiensis]|uniref:hypothetical protein n=1 Tax=Myxococcus qinghaiensis TaxID=2906758 RepID=UPI0020A770D6|nr:hypothetical protein [Myxococcus qinghaiensis]